MLLFYITSVPKLIPAQKALVWVSFVGEDATVKALFSRLNDLELVGWSFVLLILSQEVPPRLLICQLKLVPIFVELLIAD